MREGGREGRGEGGREGDRGATARVARVRDGGTGEWGGWGARGWEWGEEQGPGNGQEGQGRRRKEPRACKETDGDNKSVFPVTRTRMSDSVRPCWCNDLLEVSGLAGVTIC